jgi:hypothetical protein
MKQKLYNPNFPDPSYQLKQKAQNLTTLIEIRSRYEIFIEKHFGSYLTIYILP